MLPLKRRRSDALSHREGGAGNSARVASAGSEGNVAADVTHGSSALIRSQLHLFFYLISAGRGFGGVERG